MHCWYLQQLGWAPRELRCQKKKKSQKVICWEKLRKITSSSRKPSWLCQPWLGGEGNPTSDSYSISSVSGLKCVSKDRPCSVQGSALTIPLCISILTRWVALSFPKPGAQGLVGFNWMTSPRDWLDLRKNHLFLEQPSQTFWLSLHRWGQRSPERVLPCPKSYSMSTVISSLMNHDWDGREGEAASVWRWKAQLWRPCQLSHGRRGSFRIWEVS